VDEVSQGLTTPSMESTMTQKMYKQIEKMIRDQIVKRNPNMEGLVKAQFWGITEGFTMKDAREGQALIDYTILIRQKKNQAFDVAWKESEKELVNDLMYSSFGTTTLGIQIDEDGIFVG